MSRGPSFSLTTTCPREYPARSNARQSRYLAWLTPSNLCRNHPGSRCMGGVDASTRPTVSCFPDRHKPRVSGISSKRPGLLSVAMRTGFRYKKTQMSPHDFTYDIGVIGGCGHVGLPFALLVASKQQKVLVYDINERAVEQVRAGKIAVPRGRCGRAPRLDLAAGSLIARPLRRHSQSAGSSCSSWALRSTSISTLRSTPSPERSSVACLTSGTSRFSSCAARCTRYEREGQAVAARPWLEDLRDVLPGARGRRPEPSRVHSSLPQIVSAFDERGLPPSRTSFA